MTEIGERKMERITIKEIAKLCGVGVSTVSRAINNHPDINEETKKKIMDTIKQYNYIPNNSARNLKRSASETIGVLMKGMTNPFFTKMIRIFQEEIDRNRYDMILQEVSEEEDEVEVALEIIKEKKLKGIVFLGGYFHHKQEQLKEIPVPFVLATISLKEDIDQAIYSSVSVDDYLESYKMTKYLIHELGHKKNVILGATKKDTSIGNLRLAGYRDACLEAKIDIKNLICYSDDIDDVYSLKNGYDMTKRLLEERRDFTCLYAISDVMAIGASKALLEAGIKIPEDCAVAGFDGLEETFYYNPSITTLKQPSKEIAKEAIRILFALIYKKEGNQHIVFEGELLKRESTEIKKKK